MMISFSVAVFAVVSVACFGSITDASSTDCPTPIEPENGQYIFYQGGMSVKYSCDPGYRLVGKTFAFCQNSEWNSPAPLCLQNDVTNGDLFASYDYSCYQVDGRHIATLIRAPSVPNATSPTYNRIRNHNEPYNYYLSAVYRCKFGYRMRNPGSNTLHCSQRSWLGERPVCDYTDCSINKGGCEQICLSHPNGAFKMCSCDAGFRLAPNMRSCLTTMSTESCAVNNGNCKQKCISNSDGTFLQCSCHSGYRLFRDGKSCIRTSSYPRSCSLHNGYCSQICTPDENNQSVICSCESGYSLASDGRTCYDIDECSQDNFGCSQTCINTRGSAFCKCTRGYHLSSDGKTCEDVDECASERLNRCHHKCTNTVGSYVCSCLPGYQMLKNNTCVGCPKNSYMTEAGCKECPDNSHTVAEGKSTLEDCICDDGYSGNPGKDIPCTDIDECEDDNFGCSDECVNTPGSVHCFCPVGYELKSDQKTCVDIDECSIKNGGCEITCHNTLGSFYCSCPEGYRSSTVDAYSCIDIDECAEKNHSCNHICNNFPGGYYCSCQDGHRLDSTQKTCTAVTCSQIAVPHHAKLLCGTLKRRLLRVDPATTEFSYGTTCTFKCTSGYKLDVLPGTITCGEDGSWEGQKPKCVPLTCQPIEAPPNGNVAPASCGTRGGEVLQKCYITCDSGFQLTSNPVLTCKRNLAWHPAEFPACKPTKVLPHVACLPDVTAELPEGANSMEIDILPPTSNMDPKYISTSPEWVKNGKVVFSAGITDITYTVISPTAPNTTSSCTRTINVIDKEPPRVIGCPVSISVESSADSDSNNMISWEEPKFEDNVGVVSVAKTMEPSVRLDPGIHFVEYIAKDAKGNAAECIFQINVTDAGCKDPIGPENGYPNCEDWLFGKICEPTCISGYTFYSTEPSFYTCDSFGAWSPSNVIESCLKFIAAEDSECPDGMELRIDSETEEEICVECPSGMLWSNSSKTCLHVETPEEVEDFGKEPFLELH